MRVLPFDDVTVARECAAELAGAGAMSASLPTLRLAAPTSDDALAPGAVDRGRDRRGDRRHRQRRVPGRRGRDRFARRALGRPVLRAEGRERPTATASSTRRSPTARRRRWSSSPIDAAARPGRGHLTRRLSCSPHAARDRASARDRRRDRLGRQDRGQGSDLRRARPRQPRRARTARSSSYNNHVGVPLSLARMPARSRFGVFEMGMNHAGEIAGADRAGPPARRGRSPPSPRRTSRTSAARRRSPTPRREIFEGLEPGGTAVIPADSPHYARLRGRGRAPAARRWSRFGRAAHAAGAAARRDPGGQRRLAGHRRHRATGGCATRSPSRASTGSPTRWR